ncbi:hypothetical protein ACFQGE_10220 [Halomicroarcula sp. GCM10025817]|uniref:hypothetical protein n=1 Tax=Haloarcula TaxID=2237 RepID=UPI0023E8F080|nr:hypothetical protein [Halomicroarcula sp. SYNS111]
MTETELENRNETVEQARKEEQKGYMLNRRRMLQATAGAGAAAVGFGAGGDAVPQQLQAVDDAEAFAPLVVGAGVVLGTLSASAMTDIAGETTAIVHDFLTDADTQIKDKDSPVREAAHSTAIQAQGTSTQFLDNYENNLRFIEGNVEQVADRDLITDFDTITSESGAVSIAESAASSYLNKSVDQVLETYNFQALSAKQIMEQLDTAGFSGDYGAVEVIHASQSSDLSNVSGQAHIILEDNITFDTGGGTAAMNQFDNLYIKGNGYSINSDATYTIDQNSGCSVVYKDVTVDKIRQEDTANYYNTTVDSFTDSSGVDFYQENSDLASNSMNEVSNPIDIPVTGSSSITLDPADISSTVTTTGVTNSSEETVDLPAVEETLASSYYSEDNPATLAVPYDTSAGAFVDHTTKSLVVRTSTSGTADYAKVLPMVEFWDVINTRDSLSSNAFDSVAQYATDMYNDYISQNDTVGDLSGDERAEFSDLVKDINTDDPRSVIQSYVGLYDGLMRPYETSVKLEGVSTGDTYSGVLFSTDLMSLTGGTISAGDILDVDGGSNSETFTSVAQGDTVTVSNVPIQSITSATDSGGTDVSADVSVVDGEAGEVEYFGSSTIDLTLEYNYGVQRAFVVDTDSLEGKMAKDLTGEDFVVNEVLDGGESVGSLDVRDYDFKDTDLTESANALEDLEVTISRTDGSGGGGGGVIDENNAIYVILTVVGLGGVVAWLNRQGGEGGSGGSRSGGW